MLQAVPDNFPVIDTFGVLWDKLDTLDTNSLVIFDYCSVIGVYEDVYDRRYKKERANAKTIRAIRNLQCPHYSYLSQQERDELRGIHKKAFSKFVLIDRDVIKLIKELQARSIKVMVLTRFGLSAEDATKNNRRQDLLNYGVDLTSSFPDHKKIIFSSLASSKHTPNFDRGILSNGTSCSKGPLLNTFLKHINWWPRRVLFVDNSVEHLFSVQEALAKLNIPFEGFQYTGAQRMPAIFDPAVAAFQLDYLVKHRRWLHSSEAISLMRIKDIPTIDEQQ